jgi:hypothetical protein
MYSLVIDEKHLVLVKFNWNVLYAIFGLNYDFCDDVKLNTVNLILLFELINYMVIFIGYRGPYMSF